MNDNLIIRNATADDAAALLGIYAPYVEHTAITFEIEIPTLEDFTERIKTFSRDFPYLVAELNGKAVGYSYAHKLRERAAYNHCVEMTVYIDRNMRQHGIGKALYNEMEQRLRNIGKRNLYASVTWTDEENEYLTHDSVSFHETMGYRKVGHFHECGFKFNQWFDMIWMEKIISASCFCITVLSCLQQSPVL